LSVDAQDLPVAAAEQKKTTHRSLTLDGQEIEFSEGFAELHRRSYEEILCGRGFGTTDVRPSIQLVHDIRNATRRGLVGDYHPLAARK